MATGAGQRAGGLATMTSAVERADRYNRWILERFAPYVGRRLLEVGTGYANFRRFLPPLGLYVSVDIDAEVIARARAADPAGTYIQADIADPRAAGRLAGFDFDTVLCVNVLEHIEADEAALASMLGVLAGGGRLLLFVPAFAALYTDMDRLAGHVRRYSKGLLRARVQRAGGRVETMEYFNPVGGLGWLANRLVAYRDLDSAGLNAQVAFFDKFLTPLSKFLNPVTKTWFGQSLLAVVSKP